MSINNNNILQFCTSAPTEDLLHKCASELSSSLNSSNINELPILSQKIETLSNIIKFSGFLIDANIPKSYLAKSNKTNLSVKNAALLLLSEYTKLSLNELLEIINNTEMVAQNLWSHYVKDPDNITEEMLNSFYTDCGNNNLFLQRYYSSMNISLGSALRGYIASMATQVGGRFFDFGGGVGDLTATISKAGHKNIYFVDTDQKQLDFVKWKDQQCGLNNINYIGTEEIEDFFKSNKESFNFGTSIELLEHVINPPELMKSLATLIAPGGYLFFTSSFHVYPEPGHLKSNIQYTNKEDEIMKPLGFERVQFNNLPIPFLFNWKLFQKTI
ncbi:MAG: methyltransferase domain-containing protein [Campylobacterota bacterium]|nr:methyltransferase domain-containing protein [Campylobacterota bacterium]